MKSKWIAAGVAAGLVLIAGLYLLLRPAGTSVDSANDTAPILRILTIGESQEAAARRVSRALSEITMERLGCKVEIVVMEPAEYNEYIDNLVHNTEPADILVSPDRKTLEALMSGNYVFRLDRYLTEYPEFYDCVTEPEAWMQVSMGGYCYGIPFGNDTGAASGFLMRSDICHELKLSAGSVRDLEGLEQVLYRVGDRYPSLIPVVPHYGSMENFVCYDARANGAAGMTGGGEYCSLTELEGFRELCERMYSWRERGWILDNAHLNDDNRAEWLSSGLAFGSFAVLNEYTQRQTEYESGVSLDCVYFGNAVNTEEREAESFCVYAYSQSVDLSLSLLKLIYTDPQVRQLCVYGQEGTDYRLQNGAAVPCESEPEGGRYVSWYWPLLDEIAPPMRQERCFDQLERGENLSVFWLFDQSGVGGQVYQCGEVVDKYFEVLCAGMLEVDEGIAQMDGELADAGIDAVVAEVNRQYAAVKKQ